MTVALCGAGKGVPGLGGGAVFAWDPAADYTSSGGGSYSNGDRTFSASMPGGVGDFQAASVTSHSSGKYYAECYNDDGWSTGRFGVSDDQFNLALGADVHSVSYRSAGAVVYNGTSTPYAGNTYTTGEYCRLAFDISTGDLWLGDSAGWCGGGDPAAGTSPTISGLAAGPWFLTGGTTLIFNTGAWTLNTGQAAFNYSMPSGFSAWG